MTWQLVIQIFAALGGIAGISSLINLMISRKKVVADTTDVGQNTNDKMIKNLQDDNTTLRAEIKEAKTEASSVRQLMERLYDEIASLEWESTEQRRLIISMLNWSREAWDELCGFGSTIRQPPSIDMLRRKPENKIDTPQ